MKILITGAGGFIGRNLCEGLRDKYEILSPTIDELNLCDEKHVEWYLQKNQVDIVIHTANYGARDSAHAQMIDVMHNGLRMFYNLERCNSMYGKMYYFGSGAEYDRNHYIPFMKEDYFGQNIPTDGYGFYKYVISKETEHSNNIYDLRLFGIYGKYEQWAYRFISSNICRALKGMPLTLSKNMYFDYIYINDLVKIMEWFIEHEPKYKHYNVCRGEHIDLKTLGELIKSTLGVTNEFIVASDGMKTEYSGNNERLLKEMGGYKFQEFESTIIELAQYYETIIDTIDANLLP